MGGGPRPCATTGVRPRHSAVIPAKAELSKWRTRIPPDLLAQTAIKASWRAVRVNPDKNSPAILFS